MCGIIAVYNKDMSCVELKDKVIGMLEKQKSRGTDSWGVAFSNPGCELVRYRTTSLKQLEEWSGWASTKPGAFVIAHNRAATSTVVDWRFGHPLFSEDNKVALVHNGVVVSYMDKARELMKKGHVFETFHQTGEYVRLGEKVLCYPGSDNINDSELFVHMYEDYGAGEELMRVGSMAVCVIDLVADKLVIVRSGNPLSWEMDARSNLFFSSVQCSSIMNDDCVMTVDRNGTVSKLIEGHESMKEPYRWVGGSSDFNSYSWDGFGDYDKPKSTKKKEKASKMKVSGTCEFCSSSCDDLKVVAGLDQLVCGNCYGYFHNLGYQFKS